MTVGNDQKALLSVEVSVICGDCEPVWPSGKALGW